MRFILLIVSICLILSTAFAQAPVDQVKSVHEDPRVKAAFDYIDKNRDAILREWIAITEINAPSKQEQQRAKYIESLLRKHKLDIRYDSAGNLIATRKGTGGGPVTVFDAHMDTVFQPGLKIKATVRDGAFMHPVSATTRVTSKRYSQPFAHLTLPKSRPKAISFFYSQPTKKPA